MLWVTGKPKLKAATVQVWDAYPHNAVRLPVMGFVVSPATEILCSIRNQRRILNTRNIRMP
jgi:hypothetical protein